VRVSAEVNYDTMTKTEDKFDPDGQVVKTQTKNDENNDTSSSANTTPTGISANTVTDTNGTLASASPINNTKNHKTTSTIEYENAKTETTLTQAAGDIKRITAAVTVAQQFEGTGADRKPVVRSPEEIAKLQRIVSSALGADTTRGDTIELAELPFNDTFATDLNQQLDQQVKRDFWWTLARNSVYPALGLVALFLMFRAFKQTPVQDLPIGIPVGRLATKTANANGNGNGHSRFGDFGLEPQPGVVTVDVLNRLIKENPNNMTQAIREWMNRGHTELPHDRH